MADSNFSELPPVATPAATDEFPIARDGVPMKMTRAQIHTLQTGEQFTGTNAAAGALLDEAASSTNPTLVPDKSDPNTGVGHAGADIFSIVAGAIEAMQFAEVSSGILQRVQATVGLTADVGSIQGGGVILSSFNVYGTVGTAGDAATLPAAFGVGSLVYVKNDAAVNSMDVFPASGDDAGAGADTAVAVAAGDFAIFMGTVANATWTKIAGGTA